jgi:hypothetical protein
MEVVMPEPTAAGPRTLYKSHDIENAKQNVAQHAWAREIVDGWKLNTEYALKQDRAFFVGIIPELTPGTQYGQSCPACVHEKSLEGTSPFNWEVTDPDRITCRECGTVYPNEDYPETGLLECPRMGQTFTHYQTPGERAHPDDRAAHALHWLGDRPEMTSFTGYVRDRKVKWASGQAIALAKLYALTGDVAYAERTAWILERFAEVFPNYLFHSYDGSYADLPPAEVAASMGEHGGGGRLPKGAVKHAYGLNEYEDHSKLYNGFWGAGRLDTHGKGSGAGALLNMTVALDLIREAQNPDGRAVVDDETAQRILDDLLVPGCEDMEHWDNLTNLGVVTFSLSAAVGLLLDQPKRLHRAIDGLNRMMDERYHFDGFYAETPAYANTNFHTVRELPDLLLGYPDPDGNGTLNPFASGHFNLAMLSMVRFLAPGNRLPVIGDTHSGTTVYSAFIDVLAARLGGPYSALLETIQEKPLQEMGSEYAFWFRPADMTADGQAEMPLRTEWFPGWHVGVLRGGSEAQDTALYLDGNENARTLETNHRHRDVLSLSAYVFGRELVTDRGYFSGSSQLTPDGRSGQNWARTTQSHVLVVVDEEDQAERGCGSDLELFGTAPGIEVIQASGVNVYPQCEAYRRTNAVIQTPAGDPYFVDVFRVTGGRTHQYSFHCEGTLKQVLPETPEAEPAELSEVWTQWVDNPRAVVPETPHTLKWQDEDVSLDLMLLNGRETVDRIVITDAPGWRKASMEEFAKPSIQQILAEHRATDEKEKLTTQYAAVIVPYKGGASPVQSARLLANEPSTGVVAIEVRFADRTDIVISTLDGESRDYGLVTAAGAFAFVSIDGNGNATQGYLLNGTRLACGKMDLRLEAGSTRLDVASVDGQTIRLTAPVPKGLGEPGTYLLVQGPARRYKEHNTPHPVTGFEIEASDGSEITVRDYPVPDCREVILLNSCWEER